MKNRYKNAEMILIYLENVDVITLSGEATKQKQIVKTRIIAQNEQETDSSRKKGKFATAMATGLFGVGAGLMQDNYNRNHRKTEQVVTFLVFYYDGSKETVDATKGSETYQKLIQYLE